MKISRQIGKIFCNIPMFDITNSREYEEEEFMDKDSEVNNVGKYAGVAHYNSTGKYYLISSGERNTSLWFSSYKILVPD